MSVAGKANWQQTTLKNHCSIPRYSPGLPSTMTASDSDTDSMELKDEESCSNMFQSSLVCNRHLPYYSDLLAEAAELLAEIKVNLSLTVQKHELWPGALFWTNRLSRWV